MNKRKHRKVTAAYKEYLCTLKEASNMIDARRKICVNFHLCNKCPLNIDPTSEACCEVDYAIAKINNLRRHVSTALYRNRSEVR